jgi:hypothetical protein
MTLSSEIPPNRSKDWWPVVKIPGSEALPNADEPEVPLDSIPRLWDMTRDELLAEATSREDIPDEEIAAAISYEKIRDTWDEKVETEVDKSLDKRAVEYQENPRPKGLTLYELIEKYNSIRRVEERRIQTLKEQAMKILQTSHDADEQRRLIVELFADDRHAQEELHKHDAMPYVYKRPEILDELLR